MSTCHLNKLVGLKNYINMSNNKSMQFFNKSFWKAVFTVTGNVIGAGVLALPFLFAKAGFINSVILLLLVGLVMVVVHLCLAQITLKTKGFHQLTGYADIYLGKKGKWLMFFVNAVSIYGALIAYVVGSSEALSNIFPINKIVLALIFLVVVCFVVSKNLNFFEDSESFLEVLKFSLLMIIFVLIFSSPYFSLKNLNSFNPKSFFLPFGGLIFAFLGISSIPSIREGFKTKDLKLMKPVVLTSYLVILLTYFVFTFAVVGLTGVKTTDVATSGIGFVLGSFALVLVSFFAVFAMATPFIGLGFALKENFLHDLKFNNLSSWFLSCVVPGFLAIFILLLSKVYNVENLFSFIINITGSVTGTLLILLILLIYLKARKV